MTCCRRSGSDSQAGRDAVDRTPLREWIMANATMAPIGSSSGLLQTLEAGQALPHGSSPRMAGVAGLATSVALHAALLVAGVFLIQQVPAIMHSAVETAAPQPFPAETTFDVP